MIFDFLECQLCLSSDSFPAGIRINNELRINVATSLLSILKLHLNRMIWWCLPSTILKLSDNNDWLLKVLTLNLPLKASNSATGIRWSVSNKYAPKKAFSALDRMFHIQMSRDRDRESERERKNTHFSWKFAKESFERMLSFGFLAEPLNLRTICLFSQFICHLPSLCYSLRVLRKQCQ